MRRSLLPMAGIVFAAATLTWGQTEPPDQLPPLPAEASDPDVDVLTRGPVHEAFAEQTSPDPEAGITAPKAPPDPVNEVPPEMRPDGDDVSWVPGYWFWDEDRNDYLWVSGVWRRIPPGRRWIPGYWQQTGDSYQWVAGFWTPDTATEVDYLETPPESLETGPSSPAPSDDYFWIPGTWSWHTDQYQWQPGYWNSYRDGWTWVSARYVWTPHGCVFIPGYWDYSLTLRGHLFAPVYYRAPVYLRPGYSYRPVCWIGYEPLLLHLFVRPCSHHLYFGDYYDPLYRQRNFIPCFSYHSRHFGYSSLYVYYQHHYHHHGIDYVQRVGQWHNYYTKNVQRRPARTYNAHIRRPETLSASRRLDHDTLARPYGRRTTDRIAGRTLVQVPTELQQKFRRDSEQVRELAKTRRQFEVTSRHTTRDREGSGRDKRVTHDRLKLPVATRAPSSESTTAAAAGRVRRIPSDIARINRGDNRADPPTIRGQDAGLDTAVTRRRSIHRDAADPPGNNNTLGKARDLTPTKGNTRRITPSEQSNRRFGSATRLDRVAPSTGVTDGSSPSSAVRRSPSRDRSTVPLSSGPSLQSPSSGSPKVMRRSSSGGGVSSGSSNNSKSSSRSLAPGSLNLGAQRTRSLPSLPEGSSALTLGRRQSTSATARSANTGTSPQTKLRLPELKSPTTRMRSQTTLDQTGKSPWSKSSRAEVPSNAGSGLRSPTTRSFSESARVNLPRVPASTARRSSAQTYSDASSGFGSSRSSSPARSVRSGNPSTARSSGSSGLGSRSAASPARSFRSGGSSATGSSGSSGLGSGRSSSPAPSFRSGSSSAGRSSGSSGASSAGRGRSSGGRGR